MFHLLISYLLFFWQLLAVGQKPETFPVTNIPETLTREADVVVRRHDTHFRITNTSEATQTVRFVYTILNKNAEDDAVLHIPYSNFVKIIAIKGTLYDKNGKV